MRSVQEVLDEIDRQIEENLKKSCLTTSEKVSDISSEIANAFNYLKKFILELSANCSHEWEEYNFDSHCTKCGKKVMEI